MVEPPAHAVRCLKEWGARSVWLVQRPGEPPRTLKTWPLTPMGLLKVLVGQSQAHRQVRGAALLERAGVPTPRPMVPWRYERVDGRHALRLELEYVEGRSALALARAPRIDAAFGRRCAGRVGAVVRRLASSGLLHRDLTLENLVVAGPEADPRIWVLDPVGVRRCGSRVAAIVRMLDRLNVNVSDRDLPRWALIPAVREAVRGLPRPQRRAVIRKMRPA